MKKNKMMRLASSLLVAVLLTSSVISGTFAKYVTSDEAQDSARVAKFGVVVDAEGSLFAKSYIDAPADSGSLTVVTNTVDDDNVVAPGTKNETGFSFAVTGTPEVDVKLVIEVTDPTLSTNPLKEIFLKAANDLPDMTTGDEDDTFDLSENYYPVKYTVTQEKTGSPEVVKECKTLEELKTTLTDLNGTFDSNKNLAEEIGTIKITWAWAFGVQDGAPTLNDKCDTLLGDLAAGIALNPATTLTKGSDYNLDTAVRINVRVEQVD